MDFLIALGRAAGLSLGAGLNLYATLLALGLAVRFDLIMVPPEYAPLGSDWALAAIVLLYLIEFLADKIPWLDSVWDMIHTLVRPLGGALLAVAALGPSPAWADALIAVLGAAIAGTSHFTKAATRVAANSTLLPGPGIVLSLAEDLIALALVALVIFVPLLALAVTLVLIVLFVKLLISIRQRFGRKRAMGRA
jgi:hypothetical protein